jgi:hypothetical protein
MRYWSCALSALICSPFKKAVMQIIPGFYYHYKHDPSGAIDNYAYEVLGVGAHTEREEDSPDKYVVVYRVLYNANGYRDGNMFAIRPLDMFREDVQVNGHTVSRFRLITELGVIDELTRIRDAMYG